MVVNCSIHPWMKAWVLPRENPYFDVSKTDGSFEIANLPAGVELEFSVWHELNGSLTMTGKAGDVEIPVSGGKFKITLDKDTETEIKFTLKASDLN